MMNLKFQASNGFALALIMLGLLMLQQAEADLATAQGEFKPIDGKREALNWILFSLAFRRRLHQQSVRQSIAAGIRRSHCLSESSSRAQGTAFAIVAATLRT